MSHQWISYAPFKQSKEIGEKYIEWINHIVTFNWISYGWWFFLVLIEYYSIIQSDKYLWVKKKGNLFKNYRRKSIFSLHTWKNFLLMS